MPNLALLCDTEVITCLFEEITKTYIETPELIFLNKRCSVQFNPAKSKECVCRPWIPFFSASSPETWSVSIQWPLSFISSSMTPGSRAHGWRWSTQQLAFKQKCGVPPWVWKTGKEEGRVGGGVTEEWMWKPRWDAKVLEWALMRTRQLKVSRKISVSNFFVTQPLCVHFNTQLDEISFWIGFVFFKKTQNIIILMSTSSCLVNSECTCNV